MRRMADVIENITELAQELCRREAGKTEVNIAQMKDVLAHLSDITFQEGAMIYHIFFDNGKRRHKPKKLPKGRQKLTRKELAKVEKKLGKMQ